MAATGYFAKTATVGAVSDNIVDKPTGGGTIQLTPTIPLAPFRASASTGPAPYYTKTSGTILVLHFPSTVPFGNGALLGIFWSNAGTDYYSLDCTVSIAGSVVTVTAASPLIDGFTNGSRNQVDFTTISAGTTVITVAVANDSTFGNEDYVDFPISLSGLNQLLLTCDTVGGFELLNTGSTVVAFTWNYTGQGQFFNWVDGDTAIDTGTIDGIRFYNADIKAQVMRVGALLD